jgi:hypothetical protein
MTSRPTSSIFCIAGLVTLVALGLPSGAAAQSVEVHASASGDAGGSASAGGSATVRGTDEKAGRFMFNLKLGPALCLGVVASEGSGTCGTHMGAMVFDLGFAVIPNLYLVFPFQLQFRNRFVGIFLPFGVQYDIALPVKGLFLYPRASLGYAAFVASAPVGPFGDLTITTNFGFFMPEFGIKYVINKRWNVGGEPFSLPILFNSDGALFYYRILVYGGVNF